MHAWSSDQFATPYAGILVLLGRDENISLTAVFAPRSFDCVYHEEYSVPRNCLPRLQMLHQEMLKITSVQAKSLSDVVLL